MNCAPPGWLAARYIYDDLEDMKAFIGEDLAAGVKEKLLANPHYDASRDPQEFKGFYLEEV